MPECEALAYNLRRIRKKLHMNQFEFAAECGICIETLSTLECEKGDPKLSTLQKIAAYADCEVAELIEVRR
jgi:transcriptional regulator with XRE-family HTH domain